MPVLDPEQTITIPDVFVVPNNDHGWNVILHNDNTVYAGIVVEALQTELGYDTNKCTAIMLEAHQYGKASVIVTNKVMAEHYQERLQQYGLTITIEEV